jgi:indole-3-glycerol phosphate synthase
MCGPEATAEDVARLAAQYTESGADAIAVLTDIEESPNGLADLFATCRAVKAPVLQRDWFLHLLQVWGLKCSIQQASPHV